MPQTTLELLIKAKGDFDSTFSQLLAGMKKVDDQAKTQKSSFDDLRKGMDGFFTGNAESFKALGQGLALAGGAIATIGAAIIALGSRGADVADVREQFGILNDAIGNSADVLVKLRAALGNTVTDFDIMKTVNTGLSAGLKLTAAEMELVGKGARVLADRVGGDTKKAFDDLMMAMQKGKDGMLASVGVNVDLAAAQDRYAAKLGTTASQLNETQQLEAKRNAVLDDLRLKLAQSGEAQVDFGDRVKIGQVAIKNFTDGLGEAISQSPVVSKAMEVISNAVIQAFGDNQAATIKTLIEWINSFAIGVVKAAGIAVEAARFIGNAWQGLKVIFNAVMEGLFDATAKVATGLRAMAETAAKLPAFLVPGIQESVQSLRDMENMAKGAAKSFQEGKDAALDAAGQQGVAFDKVAGFLKNLTTEMEKAAGTTAKLGQAQGRAGKDTETHGVAVVKASKAVEEWRKKVFDLDAILKAAQKNFVPLDVVIRQYGSSIEEAARQGQIFGEELPASIARMAEAMRLAKLDEIMRAQMQGVAKEVAQGTATMLKSIDKLHDEGAKKLGAVFKAETDGHEDAEAASEQHRAALLDLANSFESLGDTIGGTFGGMLSLGADAIRMFDGLGHQAKTSAEKIQAVAGAISAMGDAYESKSITKGAAKGAAAGGQFGWVGAVIGGVVGAFAGQSGRDKQDKERAAAADKLRLDLLDLYGGWKNLQIVADQAGVSMDAAFGSNGIVAGPEEVQAAIDALNKAMEAHEQRIKSVQDAMGGLEVRTKAFADQMSRSGEASERTQAAFDRLGTYALVTFAAYVRETGDAIGALQQMGTSLDQLVALQAEFGFGASAALSQLLGLRDVVTANQDVADSISGLNQLMKSLGEAGYQNAALFNAFGADAADLFNTLIERGVGAEQAMGLMAPTLQKLWEHQQKFKDITDQATLALLDQAEKQGVVGEGMKDVNERILDVLVAIGQVLGATIPDALARAGEAAQDAFGGMEEGAQNAAEAIRNIPGNLPRPGGGGPMLPGGGAPEGYALGGTVPWTPGGRLVRVAEQGTEHIVSSAQLAEIIGRAGAMNGGSHQGGGQAINLTVPVYIGGEQLDLVINRRIAAGYIRRPE